MLTKWEYRFLSLAREVASWSADPSTKVGAVVASIENVVLSTGWNGFPRGIRDSVSRLQDREQKYHHVVHAEENAIFNAARIGARLLGSSMYVYGLPVCSHCAKAVIQSGISKVVFCCDLPAVDKRWLDEYSKTTALFHEARIAWLTFSPKDLERGPPSS